MARPAAAARHLRRMQRLQLLTRGAVRRAWRGLDRARSWEKQYDQAIGPQIVALLLAGQAAAATESDSYIAEVLDELDVGRAVDAGVLVRDSLLGVTGDGRPVETLVATAVGRARASEAARRERNLRSVRPDDGSTVRVRQPSTSAIQDAALVDAGRFLETVTQSILADTARAAEQAAMAARPWVDGWIRMVNPPCCSRCTVLSGRFYLFSEGFLRHPLCDCFHVPAPSDPKRRDALLASNAPDRLFGALTPAEQDAAFTRAGAEAIRSGADIAQVVNARRGMSTSQDPSGRRRMATVDVYGRQVYVTTEGTTRRGVAYTRLVTDRGTDTRRTVNGRRQRVASTTVPRLMPESILAAAGDDPDERRRLLRLHGYLL